MKIYKNLVNAVALTLQEIFGKGRYADKAIEKILKQNPQWGSRDRRFVAEGVYEVVRNYRLYSELAQAPNNYWFLVATWLVLKNGEVPEGQEFRHVDAERIVSDKEKLRHNLPVFESYPDWLWQLGESELGKDEWKKQALAMNKQADVFLRTNTLKNNRKDLAQSLNTAGIESEEVEGAESALRLCKRGNVFQTAQFKAGLFEVQDAGSQMIAEFLKPLPGEVIIDACAGAGGKSLHMAALMKNKGRIIAMDTEEWKLEELKKRARRAGAHNIETKLIAGENVAGIKEQADKLLLDVPCSGLGVLKRNPDTKWKLSPEVLEKTRKLQEDILNAYSKLVKTGGQMVYSTCSILPSENNMQVAKFIAGHQDFELVEEKTLLPSEGFDGFYMALLKRVS